MLTPNGLSVASLICLIEANTTSYLLNYLLPEVWLLCNRIRAAPQLLTRRMTGFPFAQDIHHTDHKEHIEEGGAGPRLPKEKR